MDVVTFVEWDTCNCHNIISSPPLKKIKYYKLSRQIRLCYIRSLSPPCHLYLFFRDDYFIEINTSSSIAIGVSSSQSIDV